LDVIRIKRVGEEERRGREEQREGGAVKVVSLEEYLTEYVHKKRPVVLTGLIEETSDWSYSSLMRVGGRIKVC
jgi:hypothetical protein